MEKIRLIQTNIEQKQKHFQLALEDLSDEYKRNDLRFANLANDIKTLREQKADEVHAFIISVCLSELCVGLL